MSFPICVYSTRTFTPKTVFVPDTRDPETGFLIYCTGFCAETDSLTEINAQLAASQRAAQSSAAQAKAMQVELAQLGLQAEAAVAEAGVAQQRAEEAEFEVGKLREEVCVRGAAALDAEQRLEVAELRFREVEAAAASESAASSGAEVRGVKGFSCRLNYLTSSKLQRSCTL